DPRPVPRVCAPCRPLSAGQRSARSRRVTRRPRHGPGLRGQRRLAHVPRPRRARLPAAPAPRLRDRDVRARGLHRSLGFARREGSEAPAPPPDSWAANAEADVAIWLISLAPGAKWTLPPARSSRTARTLYFFSGSKVDLAGRGFAEHAAVDLKADQAVPLTAA